MSIYDYLYSDSQESEEEIENNVEEITQGIQENTTQVVTDAMVRMEAMNSNLYEMLKQLTAHNIALEEKHSEMEATI